MTDERALPLRERKRLRTRRALAEAALRMFTERGFDATTLDELVDSVDVSKSTFFRTFPCKEAAAIEAETELWTSFVAALAGRELTGLATDGLRDALEEAAQGLEPGWDERYVATRRLIVSAPSLMAYVEHYRAGVRVEAVEVLAGKLGLDADDLRLPVLAELTMTAWSTSGRVWVRAGGQGGRKVLIDGMKRAFAAIPAALSLSAG
ncbi:TetR family transcriptional regulator [Nonomuraea sp. NPDC050556]|uniref:TetR family transcriptional regulator n=1 Tax=Nonomuraea sp. NPDC050556 TaxID=3364369 RepID=UPI0037AD9846